ESAGEVIHRQPGDGGQRLDADGLLQMGLDEFAHASQRSRRQATANAQAELRDRWSSDVSRGCNESLGRRRLPRVGGITRIQEHGRVPSQRRKTNIPGWACPTGADSPAAQRQEDAAAAGKSRVNGCQISLGVLNAKIRCSTFALSQKYGATSDQGSISTTNGLGGTTDGWGRARLLP